MPSALTPSERHVITFHWLYAMAAGVGFYTVPREWVGPLIFALVAAYNIALPLAGRWLGHDDWIVIWLFLVPLSLFQVFPDHVLATHLGTLVFPDLGTPRLGAVNAFMAGMWTIPLFLITFLGLRLDDRFSRRAALLGVGLASLVILVGSEAVLPALPIWYAQGVETIGHVALYVIVPEILLGIATFLAVERSPRRKAWENLLSAGLVSAFYLLCLLGSYVLIERVVVHP